MEFSLKGSIHIKKIKKQDSRGGKKRKKIGIDFIATIS